MGEKIPVDLLLLESAVKRDELDQCGLDKVDDKIPFELDPNGREKLRKLLSEEVSSELLDFIKDSYFLLKEGASPLEISRKLNLPLEWTKYMIHRLRVMKIVRVKRKEVDGGVLDRVKKIYRKITFLLRRSENNE